MYLCLYFDCLIDLLADPFEQKLPLREGDEIVGEKVLLLWRQACCVVCQSNWKQQENKVGLQRGRSGVLLMLIRCPISSKTGSSVNPPLLPFGQR